MVSTQCKYVFSEIGKNIDENHLSKFLALLIEIFQELEPEYFRRNVKGRKRSYPIEELLGLHFWGDLNNKASCREKAALCKNNDESVQVLISGKPEKSKINDFERQQEDLIHAFDDFIVEFCYIIGLVDAEEFVADGTFLDGYCNDYKALYPDEIEYTSNFLTQSDKYNQDYELLYSYYYDDVELNDEILLVKNELKDNINIHGINLIIKALENDKAYNEVMAKLEHMRENITKDKVKVSITDPDAHFMKDKDNNWGFHYNLQEITDPKYGIIVDHYLTKNPNDKNEVKKIVLRLIEKFDHEGFSLSVDHGYWNIKLLIEIIQETLVEIVIPDKNSARETKQQIIKDSKSNKKYKEYLERKNKNKKQKTFIDIKDFDYIDEKDAYQCPVMKYLLEFQKIIKDDNGIEYREYWTNKCKKCPHHDECTSQDKRKIQRINEPEIIHINEYFQSNEGKQAYSKRSPYAEGGFGIMFEARNFRGSKERGLKKANTEITRFIIEHNILKIVANVDLKVLKKILKYIKGEKKHRRASIDILYELKGNFIEKNGKIIDVLI